jgi:hypothetical protein
MSVRDQASVSIVARGTTESIAAEQVSASIVANAATARNDEEAMMSGADAVCGQGAEGKHGASVGQARGLDPGFIKNVVSFVTTDHD